MTFLFTLNGHEVVPADDPVAWAEWFEAHHEDSAVGRTQIGDYTISTVFLGCAHTPFTLTGPSLFETAVFCPGVSVRIVARYRTWDDAAEGHAIAVAEIAKTVLS